MTFLSQLKGYEAVCLPALTSIKAVSGTRRIKPPLGIASRSIDTDDQDAPVRQRLQD